MGSNLHLSYLLHRYRFILFKDGWFNFLDISIGEHIRSPALLVMNPPVRSHIYVMHLIITICSQYLMLTFSATGVIRVRQKSITFFMPCIIQLHSLYYLFPIIISLTSLSALIIPWNCLVTGRQMSFPLNPKA